MRPAATSDTAQPPFLAILYDREDFLQAISDNEGKDEDAVELESFIDPRLLSQSIAPDGEATSTASSTGASRSQQPSAESSDEQIVRYHGLTQLNNRQAMIHTIRLHPNVNLRNLFGNLPFSSSVRTNNYPPNIQDAQVNNLFLPTWAMMTVNIRPDPGSVKIAFYRFYQEIAVVMESGATMGAIIETHPNIAALLSEDEYNRSGVLSRWAVGMVHSAQLKGNDFTAFASMYLMWYLARWMVSPSPATYEIMPEWLRPTPNQLFMPHINILDFIVWPAFRELAVEIPEMHERMEYLLDMSTTIRCDWYFGLEEAIQKDDETGMLDLCELAKTTMRELTSWSVGPSFRQYVTNADSYVRIRAEDS